MNTNASTQTQKDIPSLPLSKRKRLSPRLKRQRKKKLLPPMDEEIEAYENAVHDTLKEEAENKSKLEELAKRGERELLRIKTVFPFILFPDELIIDENKITIVIRQFFKTKNVRSILHKDIANVNMQTSLFFATIAITDQYFSKNPVQVKYLKKNEATLARQMIQGLMVAHTQKVEVSQLNIDEAKEKLIQIGKIHHEMQS